MTRCPESFSGTIDEFYTRYVLPNLPAVNTVFAFHRAVAEYCAAPDPLFLIRHVSGTERGKVITTRTGAHVKPTDNAPAWWFHHALFHGTMFDAPSLAAAIESAPAHFFEVAARTPDSINAARCHVAHILPVKDGNTAYLEWDHAELTARFVRNVHPCNYFFVATTGWQRWGGDPHIIDYFADRYADRYAPIWPEFLRLAGASRDPAASSVTRVAYSFAAPSNPTLKRRVLPARGNTIHSLPPRMAASDDSDVASYRATRLLFKAAIIEPLDESGRFRIITPNGVFEMSKGEFYHHFPNVVSSRSYQERGVYHYPTVPAAALRFLVRRP